VPERFPVRAKRFVVSGQQDAGVFLDDLGMLEAPGFVIGKPGGLVEMEALAGEGSFCLLGEPGAGKTTALEAIAGQLPGPDDAGQAPVIFVPMAEVTDAAVFQERAIDPVLAGASAGRRMTLVLDGLEECPVPGAGKALAGLLRQLLRQTDPSALRLLVGCRSAEYPSPVHEVLAEAIHGFVRYELAPLRRGDVLELAASRAVPADDFLTEVARTGTGPLASFPLTLDLLLRQCAADGGLHGTAAELYGSALLALVSEHDPDRDPALASLPPGQVLAVAARLCCYLLVCGRAGFWTGPVDQMPPGDLDTGSLSGGQERQVGGTFEVTGTLIAAALRSALFAAYLAGRHLASRQLPAAQLRSLLTVPAEREAGIIPALRETAAWLLALQPTRLRKMQVAASQVRNVARSSLDRRQVVLHPHLRHRRALHDRVGAAPSART
jgi:NACHT domain